MKFQYSPGLIGYGAKGADGSSGLTGLGLYFTDINPLTDFIRLQTAIQNNEVLWSTAAPGTLLPAGRQYQVDDLIIDTRGYVYIITDPATGDYNNSGMSLNKSTFFQSNHPSVISDNGFERCFNKIDPSLRYIIDNVFTDIAGLIYTLYPSKIYGVSPNNFARIEYSNIKDVSYNAFTIYSSGENAITDDNKSIAIVRDVCSNVFRIGNLDSSNFLRDIDLIWDASSLRQKKESGNRIYKNTPSGTILTNAEKNANSLFDGVFNSLPSSFTCAAAPSHVTFNWNLSDFSNDPSISGVLYFYSKENASGNFNMDPSMLRPLVFHNVGNTGNLIISALTLGKTYEYYMSLCKDGWERNSVIRPVTTANTPANFVIVNPSPPTLTFPAISSKYVTTITTDSFTGWNMTDVPAPNWISTLQSGIPFNGSPTSGTYTFDISISGYSGYLPRTGVLTFTSEAPVKTINITQNRRLPIFHNVSMSTYVNSTTDAKGRVNISPPLDPGQTVSLTAYLKVKAHAHGSISHNNINTYSAIDLFKNGVKVADCSAFCHSAGGNNNTTIDLYVTVPGIINGDIIEIRQQRMECLHFTSGVDAYGQSGGYMRLDSMGDGYDTFNIVSSQRYWDVTKYYGDGCIFTSRVDSVPESWVDV